MSDRVGAMVLCCARVGCSNVLQHSTVQYVLATMLASGVRRAADDFERHIGRLGGIG